MISPTAATTIIILFLILFGVILPILNIKYPKYISFRWLCVVVVLGLLIGAVIDFSELDNDARHIVLLCGFIIVCLYVLLRTLEKMAYNKNEIRLKLKHGDSEGSVVIGGKDDEKKKSQGR